MDIKVCWLRSAIDLPYEYGWTFQQLLEAGSLGSEDSG